MYIPFVQYLRPDGRRRDTRMHTADRVLYAKSQAILDSGFVFETELLTGDIVSLTITHPTAGDMVCELVRNGPDVPARVASMITKFDVHRALARVAERTTE